MSRGQAAALGCCLLAAGAGCLPDDTRPTPGSLELQVRSAQTSSDGFVTEDGWRIVLDRLLAGIGTVRIEGDGCNPYNQGWYSRVFDFAQPLDEPAKVALLHGIGDCNLRFRLRGPQDDSIIGAGVSPADLEAMRAEELDVWGTTRERVTLLVRGSATKDERTLTFEWAFRVRYDIRTCRAPENDDPFPTVLDLRSGEALRRVVDIDASALFRVPKRAPPDWSEGDPPTTGHPAAGVPARFEMFANADGHVTDSGDIAGADGDITLEELADIDADTGARLAEPSPSADPPPRRLLGLLYFAMAPAIAQMNGALCFASIDD